MLQHHFTVFIFISTTSNYFFSYFSTAVIFTSDSVLINLQNDPLLNSSGILLLNKYLLGAHSTPDPVSDTNN